jgi:hypothetical protein
VVREVRCNHVQTLQHLNLLFHAGLICVRVLSW